MRTEKGRRAVGAERTADRTIKREPQICTLDEVNLFVQYVPVRRHVGAVGSGEKSLRQENTASAKYTTTNLSSRTFLGTRNSDNLWWSTPALLNMSPKKHNFPRQAQQKTKNTTRADGWPPTHIKCCKKKKSGSSCDTSRCPYLRQ